jgi:hypothetical protein
MQVSAYVDRRLDAQTLHAFDQHLAVCLVCRHAADEERRILTSLRSAPTPGFSPTLQSMLLALAQPEACVSAAHGPSPLEHAPARGTRHRTAVPPIPEAPDTVRQLRVPTVPPAAPALHRSPRRAAMVAGLAAGASAAAAIGLAAVAPSTGAAATTVRAPANESSGTATVRAVPALFSGSVSSPFRQVLPSRGR